MKVFIKAMLGFLGGLVAIFVAGIVLLNVLFSNNLSKRQIINLIEKNSATILQDISEDDFSDSLKIKGLESVRAYDGVVDFRCGGSGFGSATSYYGFYYSPDNEPAGFFAGTSISGSFELKPDGDGYSYQEENSDNRFYTEKITDCFYYYESHF